ncbi:MAG: hypothetical protein HY234_04290 [Acidobacteria bacterium]|nr:hypothetical protein [Acidobacteriota bacterium]MBI3662256.1 hypothetical protein [Acidobacteriota bacterium]
MADQQGKFDPFKPAQPRIPGVSDASAPPPAEAATAPTKPAARGKLPPQWIAIGAAGAVLLGIGLGWLLLRPSTPAEPPAASQSAPASSPSPEAAAIQPASPAPVVAEVPPLYPDEVATTEEMDKPWASKRFTFMKKIAVGPVPALLVRLPGGSAKSAASYWAFALKSRYGKCELELVADLEKLRSDYGYRAQHPMVAEPCTNTVFDPLQRGTVSGAWVRGAVVQGSALRPPLMIDVQIKGNRILAVQME